MQLTTRSRYGLRAMIYIANHSSGEPVALSDIATGLVLSETYLEQLLRKLKKGGFISSARGVQGGYFLASPAANIRILDLLTCLEGPLWLSECVHAGDCPGGFSNCPTRVLIRRMSDGIIQAVGDMNLQDMVDMTNAV